MHHTVSISMLVVALGATVAQAQRSALREVRDWGSAGGGLILAAPVGEFQDHVKLAGGLGGFVAFSLNRRGALALRLDGSFLAYDQVRELAQLTGPYLAVPIGVNTTSYFVSFRAGPQLTFGDGPVRLYGFGLGGLSYFATETSYDGFSCGCDPLGSVTNYGDVTAAWEAGGGLQIRLGRQHTPVRLDLGARYLHHGRARYLPARILAGVATIIRPIESEANLVLFQLGVTVGLR